MSIWRRMLTTERDWTATILRVTLGIVMLPHGAQKLLGWFGGFGVEGTLGYFSSTLGIPVAIGFLVIVAEFFGALGLITGFLTRLSAVGIAAVMVGAVFIGGHIDNGFFMNWSGQQAGEGFEFHLLALGIAAAVCIKGAGAASIDRVLAERVRVEGVDIPVRRPDREREGVTV